MEKLQNVKLVVVEGEDHSGKPPIDTSPRGRRRDGDGTEKALQDAEFRDRSLFDNAVPGIFRCTQSGKFIEVNASLAKMHGFESPGEMMDFAPNGEPCFVQPERLRELLEMLGRCDSVKDFEFQAYRKDGSKIWLSQNTRTIHSSDNRSTYFEGIVQDISERKRVEEALSATLERQEALLAAVPDIIMEVDEKRVYTWANQAGIEFYGEDVIGKEAAHYFDNGQETHSAFIPLYSGSERVVYVETWQRRRDGEMRLLAWWCRALKNQGGKVIGALSSARDITDGKLAEQALRESEERYRIAIECSNDGVAISKGKINLFVNQKYVDMFGYQCAEDLIGKPVSTVLHPDSIALWENLALKRQSGEHVPNQYELKGVRKNGEILYLEVSSVRTFYRGEAVSLAYVRNITKRKRAEEQRQNMELQLRQAQKLEAIGQLAAGIAHEINTPTQYVGDNIHFLQDAFGDLQKVLKSYNRLLQACHAGTVDTALLADVEAAAATVDLEYLADEIPKAVAQSLVGINRVATIVQAMKEFSHPGSDEKQTINLNHAIENTLTVCRNEWKYVSEVVTQLDPELPMVPCLPADINQAVLNLVVNAAHAIADATNGGKKGKGTITLSTRRDGNHVELRVGDTGTGIPEQHRSKIFNPFFTTKGVGRGTGQGLSITRSTIVGKHGGTIDFETEVGHGTTFIIRLPLFMESAPPTK
jgi:two-component system NtrC family sensor kinase